MMAVPPDYSVPLPFYGASLPDVYPPMNHGLDYNLPPPIPVPHSSVSQPLNPFPIPTNVPPPNMATYSTVPPPPIDSAQGAYYYNDYNNYYSKMGSYGYSTENYDYSNSSTLNSDLYYESRPSIISSEHHNDPSPYYSYDNTHNNESRLHRNRSYRSSRSPSQSRLRRSHSFSPPKYYRDRDKCYREKSYYREGKDYNRYDRKFYSPERRHSPRRQSPRRHSLRGLSPRRHSPRRHSPRRHSPIRLSPRRHSPKQNRPRRFTPDRRYSPGRRHTPGRRYTPERYHSYSAIRYEESRHSRRSSTVQDSSSTKESVRPDRGTPVELSDREKILREYRKNYCSTSEDLIKKMEQWSREQDCDNEKSSKMWYRSSPAELYYTPVEGNRNMQQTQKLTRLCETFFVKLIERGRKARPEIDELPPLKPQKPKLCKHKFGNDKLSSSSSSDSEESLDEDGLQGYADRVMMELQRKQNHPRRLHPEMWFNNPGEMNGGPLCRCSARARRHGMRHGVYAGEETFPRCILTQNNIDRLYHYRITVSPPTNFLIKMPTIINHDEHEFLFSGFSMFTHYKLSKLPTCKVIRFNIEYTILYVEEPMPQNFTVQELDLFEEYLFTELLELVDLDLGKSTDTTCSQFHFMPRFVRNLSEGGCEVLSMCEVLKYLINRSGLLIPPEMLDEVHEMDHYTWQKFIDKIKGMIVTNPGKKPCSVRVDQLDRSPPVKDMEKHNSTDKKKYYPEIVHFGIRPPQLSYAGNPEYQKAWRFYVKYRHLIANMSKPSYKDRQKLSAKENRLQEMRTQSNMKRDVTVAISSEGFHTTGLMCDVVQHAMLIPVLVRHLRFHKSLDSLEKKIGYSFKTRALLQTALTHPSYRENFGTTPDHARNSLTNCGIRQPEYGDRRIHYTRKKGIVTLINIMSRFGNYRETESGIKHNERLEFLGDAVVEFLSSIHLFRMFPGLAEGGLATYRAAIVQNQHLAQLAKNIGLECYMLYAHGSDLCREVVMRHAMANCFEALMGALFLDAGIEVADRVFALALWHNDPELQEVWCKERAHPLQEQEPLGDRKYIKDFEFLQRLTKFEDSIGIQFKHIRLLARAFTDRSVGFTHLTLGSNQRLEFLGDTVLQLVVSDKLYRHFPEHHEGHLSLLRSSLVNNRTQAMVCDDLNMSSYAIYNNPEAKPTTKKHKADLLEAFLGALYIDKNFEYCQVFCNACLFPRLQEFILNQDWNDPKSKLQQCCLTLRSMKGGEPDIPVYKVIECLGPTNTRVYTVAVYFRGARLAAARGHSIQKAEMNAAEEALNSAHALFPQLDHQKRVIAKIIKRKKRKGRQNNAATKAVEDRLSTMFFKRKQDMENVPKAYRLDKQSESSDESSAHNSEVSDNELNVPDKSDDSGLDSDTPSTSDKTDNIQVSSLLTDMQNMKEQLIKTKEYDKLKQKYKEVESDDDL